MKLFLRRHFHGILAIAVMDRDDLVVNSWFGIGWQLAAEWGINDV
jgi:hypothetical protein